MHTHAHTHTHTHTHAYPFAPPPPLPATCAPYLPRMQECVHEQKLCINVWTQLCIHESARRRWSKSDKNALILTDNYWNTTDHKARS